MEKTAPSGGMWMDGITVAKIALSAATYAIDKPYDYTVKSRQT